MDLANNVGLRKQMIDKQIREAVKKRISLGEENKQRIFFLILKSEPEGMTTRDLVSATGLNRRTIRGICRNYQNKGLLNKISRKGQYHLSSKATRIDDPTVGSFLVLWNMISSRLFELGDIALSSSMDFVNAKHVQQILNSQKQPNKTKQKEALGKFFLFEFALRVGATILYIMIQSMKYADPSLSIGESRSISESMKNQLLLNRYKGINPIYFKVMFEELLLILEHRIWKEYNFQPSNMRIPPDIPKDEKMDSVKDDIYSRVDSKYENLQNILMKERIKEMEKIYQYTFPAMFESIQDLGFDMVYEPSLTEVDRMEKEDPDHTKCGGKLSERRFDPVGPGGRVVKRCLRCKRWVPVEKSKI